MDIVTAKAGAPLETVPPVVEHNALRAVGKVNPGTDPVKNGRVVITPAGQ